MENNFVQSFKPNLGNLYFLVQREMKERAQPLLSFHSFKQIMRPWD